MAHIKARILKEASRIQIRSLPFKSLRLTYEAFAQGAPFAHCHTFSRMAMLSKLTGRTGLHTLTQAFSMGRSLSTVDLCLSERVHIWICLFS